MGSKVDLEKFTGQNDFNMWKIKMEALLIAQGLGEAIDPVSKLEGNEFNKVCDELETIDEGLSDESKTLLLISYLPKSYEHFVDALLYGRQTLSPEEVKSALGTKKLKDKQDNPESESKWHFKRDCPAVGEANITDNRGNKSMLWHLRMGHMSERGLRELQNQEVFGKDQMEALGFCEDCILGKSSRLRFETAAHTTKEKLGYIHSDLWGPAQVNSLDNGLEYCNKLFEEFCEKNGIQRHKTITYTPQQNGLAEKMNRTLVEKVRCMLIYSKLPKTLWEEALNTACYLVNMSPSTAIGFWGYPKGVKGYRLWCVDSKPPQCIISRDVIFHEDEFLNRPRSPINNTESGAETNKVKFQVEPHNLKELEPEIEGAKIEPEAGVEHESAESEEDVYQLARDRKRRTIRPPKRYAVADLIAYVLTAAQELNDDEPRTYQEAITGKNKLEWKRAMDEEMASLMKNKTWELIEKPAKRKTVSCKWIFKIKDEIPSAELRRFKARLVARGFTQKEGIDFTKVFSPVVRHASIRIILALVAVQDMHLEQMDVKTTFLHGELQEEIVIQQPKGYVTSGKEDCVCLLKKSLYGLKQSPRQWYLKFDNFMITHAFNMCNYDCCVYFKETSGRGMIYLLLYVDDMLIACHDKEEINHLKKLLSREFEMKFMANPGYEHWRAVQWIMRYLKGTLEVGLVYGGEGKNGHTLIGYVDADFAGDLDKRRSQIRYLFTLGGCIVSWKATLHNVMALSTTEAEYTAAAEAFKEAIWLKGMTSKLGAKRESVTVYSDSQSAIHLNKNQSHYEKTKHIDVKLHFVRLEVSRGAIKLLKIHTEENPADMLTKVVPSAKFILCMNLAVDVGTLKGVELLKFLCVLDLFELCSLIFFSPGDNHRNLETSAECLIEEQACLELRCEWKPRENGYGREDWQSH
ncbi:Integrase catalytic domain-containing protein [Citrus sinensis]|nr:Integrase catalytic domain-containing protein [Citrus sinensis]